MSANSTTGAGGSRVVRTLLPCFLLLLFAAGPARALDPERFITQYGHAAWRTKDGDLIAPAGITQTKDGYIWIGSYRDKLVRYRDGRTEAVTLGAENTVSIYGLRVDADNALWIAPRRVYGNPAPPPVHVEGLVADRRRYQTQGRVVLPPLRGELEIDYMGLSFTLPRRVGFRYKLEGHDAEWQDVGARRQAFYNNLGPGSYTFRVAARNGDGVWDEEGAALAFSIEPTWYQTTAFRLLVVFLIASAAWGLYRLRIRRVARVIGARFDERLAERTRLARELHDTLLQTLQGSKLVADSALEQPGIPDRVRRALEQLSGWLEQANEEGRAALNSLRTSTTERDDLAAAFRRAVESCRLGESAGATFSVVGDAREMHSVVRDEIYRVGYEAIRNACRHSKATRLEVELRYAHDLTLRVTDNGVGLDPVVASEGKAGHYGVLGMRERAARIDARLTIDSSRNSGTRVTLVVPGGIVFSRTGAAPPGA